MIEFQIYRENFSEKRRLLSVGIVHASETCMTAGNKMIISERIFKLLKEKEISQKEFSEKTGIAQSTISDWKRKKTNPAADKIMVICEVLGITPYELLTGTDSGGKRQIDYVIVDKNSNDYIVLEQFHSLSSMNKGRFLGYLKAMAEEKAE